MNCKIRLWVSLFFSFITPPGGIFLARYTLKRLVQLIPILIVVSAIIFFMIRISNVDPVAVILGGKQTTPDVVHNVRVKFGLDKPTVIQYFLWIKNMFHGDFGESYKFQQSVSSLVAGRLPVTVGLVFLGSLLALLVAIPFGVLSALKKNTWVDRSVSILSLILVSSPVFMTSVLIILFLSNAFPNVSFTGDYDGFADFLQRLIFPSIAMAFSMIALVSRITRSSMIKQLQSNYILTATAKGLPKNSVVFKHAFKNAMIPVITVTSIQVGAMIVGAVLVENVFSLPGVGSLLIDSIKASDYPVVQDISLMLVVFFLLLNLIVDVVYALIDPRIRLK